jgi:hypothetical protein
MINWKKIKFHELFQIKQIAIKRIKIKYDKLKNWKIMKLKKNHKLF